jgi:hypothetical protein
MKFILPKWISFTFIFIGITFFFSTLNWSVKLKDIQESKFIIIGLLYTGYGFGFYRIFDGLFQADHWNKKKLFLWAWLKLMLSIPLLVYVLVYILLPQIGIYFDTGKYPFSFIQFLFRLLFSSILVNIVPLAICGIKSFFHFQASRHREKKLQNKIERYVLQLESRHIAPHFVKNFVALSYQQNLKNDPKLMEAYFMEFTSLMGYMLDSDNLNDGVSAEEECDMFLSFSKLICLVYGDQAVQFNKPLQGWAGRLPAGLLLLPIENALKYGIWRKGHCGLQVNWEQDGNHLIMTCKNQYDAVKRNSIQSLGTGFSLMQHKIEADDWPISISYRDQKGVFIFQINIQNR